MAALIMPSISAGFIGMLLSLSLKSCRQSCRAALVVACSAAHVARQPALVAGPEVCQGYGLSRRQDQAGVCALGACPPDRPGRPAGPFPRGPQAPRLPRRHREGGVEGKRWSGRVSLGGCRFLKKKKKKYN